MLDPRKVTNELLEKIEEGLLDKDEVINACLSYMSEDDVADMCQSEGFLTFEEDEEEFENDSIGTIYDEVLDILDQNDFDITSEKVKEYAKSASEYIEMTRTETEEEYTVEQWYEETLENYPKDLKALR